MPVTVPSRARATVLIALGVASGLALFLASQAPSAPSARTLRVVMHSALRITDPTLTTAYITRDYGYMVYDTLLGMNSGFEVRPQMADWTVSVDGLTYVFTLRQGLRWHDGQPVTAADCVASIRRWAVRDGLGQMLLEATESLEAVDASTIRLRLKRPVRFVLKALGKLSSYPAFMMPQRIAAADAASPIREYIGSGPFKFVAEEFQPGVKAVFARNEGYVPRAEPISWTAGGKTVAIDRVEWSVLPDPQVQINALRAGEIDMIESVPFDLLPILKSDPDIEVRGIDPLGFQIMGRMNFLHPPFNDVEIRRAALLALNQRDFLQALVGDPAYYKLCGAMFICDTPLATDAGARPVLEDSMEAARQALKASRYDGTPIVILQPTDVGVLKTHPVVAAQLLRQAGFNVDTQAMDWQTLIGRRASQKPPSQGGWNMFFTVWSGTDLLDPLLNQALNGRGRDGAWFGWPDDPKLEAYRQAYAQAETLAEQRRIAAELQAYAYDQVIAIPLGQFMPQSAWRKELSGVRDSPIPLFWGVEKK